MLYTTAKNYPMTSTLLGLYAAAKFVEIILVHNLALILSMLNTIVGMSLSVYDHICIIKIRIGPKHVYLEILAYCVFFVKTESFDSVLSENDLTPSYGRI